MISANLEKFNIQNEHCKEDELIDHYYLHVGCGRISAGMSFCVGGGYKDMAVGLRELADILEEKL
jgi:hypothetical protein